jgi:hypothetical protein
MVLAHLKSKQRKNYKVLNLKIKGKCPREKAEVNVGITG